MKKRFTEEQIIQVLKEQEAGVRTADVCRRHGISGATFYKWKAKFGGMSVSDAQKLRALEAENSKLKRLPQCRACMSFVSWTNWCSSAANRIVSSVTMALS